MTVCYGPDHGELVVFEDFLAPEDDLTWVAGGGNIGELSYVSVNEGTFEWTVDEAGGVLAVTTDTGDDDNFVLKAGRFKPADGGMVMEARFKFNNLDCAIFTGFTETLALDTPVMPAEFATDTMTYQGTGGMIGVQYDVDGTTDDFRAVQGDAGAALTAAVRANDTPTVDEWYIARVEVQPDGQGRVYLGHMQQELTLVKTFTTKLTPTDLFYAVLMIENRSGNARVLEVDYMEAKGYRDWTVQ